MKESKMKYKRLFVEVAKSITDAEKENLGLLVVDLGSKKQFFLYNTEKLSRLTNLKDKGINFKIADCVCATSQINKSKNSLKSWQVDYIGAEKGWGILLYDIMLSDVKIKGLSPDPLAVSASAKKVWEYYYTKRSSEIETKPILNSISSTSNIKGRNNEILDRIYYLKPEYYTKTQKLKNNHKQCKSKNPEIFKNFTEELIQLVFNQQSANRR